MVISNPWTLALELAALLAVAVVDSAQETAPSRGKSAQPAIPVRAMVGTGPFYVAQEIAVQVTVIGGSERPEVMPPTVPGATLTPAGTSLRPLTTSAIGDFALQEANAFVYLYRLVPDRPGTLLVPPFVVREGDRRGVTRSLRIEVRTPPALGRPAAFVGGVGPLEVRVDIEPRAVRVGQSFEYRVQLSGPGSRGSTRLPAEVEQRLGRLAIEPRIASMPVESNHEPPSRLFRVQVRPTRAGEVTLPPVVLAWFDPLTRTYQTIATEAPRIRVIEVPALDTTLMEYLPPPAHAWRPGTDERLRYVLTSGWFWAGWWLPLGTALLAWGYAVRRGRRRGVRAARRAARRLSRVSHAEMPLEVVAREILESLEVYLGYRLARPRSVPTPLEVEESIRRITGNSHLAARAAEVVRICEDRLYSRHPETRNAGELCLPARELFQELATLSGDDLAIGKRQYEETASAATDGGVDSGAYGPVE